MFFKTKSVEIEAVQWIGSNLDEILSFCEGNAIYENELIINTLEGKMHVRLNDYIIRGMVGEYYPCKQEAFNKKYELINK